MKIKTLIVALSIFNMAHAAEQPQKMITLEADNSDISFMGALGIRLMLGSVKDEKIKEEIINSLDGNAGLVGTGKVIQYEDKEQKRAKITWSWTVLTTAGQRIEHSRECYEELV